MANLNFKFVFVLSCIYAFCLGIAATATCPAIASTRCIPGLPGRDGQAGPPGPNGFNGHNGHNGTAGTPGPQGPAGLNGTDGQLGQPGPQGPQGSVGMQGMKGNSGEPGPAGSDGIDGVDGSPGRNGTDGLPGPSGNLSDAAFEQLKRNILEDVQKLLYCKGSIEVNPATSCKEIYECNPTAPSGHYWVNTTTGVVQVLCSDRIADCYDAMMRGANQSGVYTIQPNNATSTIDVFCDMETDGGGWTVLLKRQDGSVDFDRNWIDHKSGFGNPEGEHWLGLDNMYLLTHQSGDPPQLRVDLADREVSTAFAKYDQFSVGDEDSNYTLSVSGYQLASTAGDSLTYHNEQMFSTPDRDNDESSGHCSGSASWWYRECYVSLLTGRYYSSGGPATYAVNWYSWQRNYISFTVADMKIKPGGV